jgi:hypothetical protein
VVEIILIMVLVAAAVVLVASPLRPGRATTEDAADSAERAELQAARDAKYREIRDAELDYRTGKLSEADWRSHDRALRREAVELLRRLDALGDPEGEPRETNARTPV